LNNTVLDGVAPQRSCTLQYCFQRVYVFQPCNSAYSIALFWRQLCCLSLIKRVD